MHAAAETLVQPCSASDGTLHQVHSVVLLHFGVPAQKLHQSSADKARFRSEAPALSEIVQSACALRSFAVFAVLLSFQAYAQALPWGLQIQSSCPGPALLQVRS